MIQKARETDDPDPEDWLGLMGWVGITVLAAVYLSRFLTGAGAQVVGGVAIWLALFAASGMALKATINWWASDQ